MLYWIKQLKKLTNEQVAETPKRSVLKEQAVPSPYLIPSLDPAPSNLNDTRHFSGLVELCSLSIIQLRL